jgi:hypothetical protein
LWTPITVPPGEEEVRHDRYGVEPPKQEKEKEERGRVVFMQSTVQGNHRTETACFFSVFIFMVDENELSAFGWFVQIGSVCGCCLEMMLRWMRTN